MVLKPAPESFDLFTLLDALVLAESSHRARVGWIEVKLNAAITWTKIMRIEVLLDSRVLKLTKKNKLRHVLIERPQSIVDPRTDDWLR